MTAQQEDDVLSVHLQEIRRGSVVIACLTVLRQPQYGYSLLRILERAGIQVDGNTLYPLLRRLERQGLLTSDWNTEDTRPRKFYRVSPLGERILERLSTEWTQLDANLRRLLRGEGP
jgi:DNA-binding PadR family transcriptional regulator